ncbi:CRISPR-associated protein Cas2 [Jeotgalibacillus alimentarius]|uniref:CRISPR-associated protein Cas2 n=1 Tax=Jeotgalibacillus alimentarius TaxID=135826 RepID=A0A0C2WBX3_9BACL|nr:AAA family ATPase [Jeotgalibacillus alimentarius]KIL53528.1 CRISPR-associated protein Cas2 [Jeotgalibacillus alimentarius]
MKRLAIITVGKTHSGKTTFARQLEQKLTNSFVMDQDAHAEFLNTYYKMLQPKEGPNILKHSLTKLVVEYAKEYTGFHFIVSNSNRAKSTRQYLLEEIYSENEFTRILVHFDLSDDILYKRVENSARDTNIFRGPYTTFKDVLIRQEKESELSDIADPDEGEADYLFVVNDPDDVDRVIEEIVALADV